MLAVDFWVPGTSTRADLPKYQGKTQFQEILKPNDRSCIIYAARAIQDQDLVVDGYLEQLVLRRFMYFRFCFRVILSFLFLPEDFTKRAPKSSTTKAKAG